MNWIFLDGIEIKAPIGVGEEEKQLGNTINVDVGVFYDFTIASRSDNIDQTVDYAELYEIVNEKLSQPTNLLETVSMEILLDIFRRFKQVEQAKITIRKISPPINGQVQQARILLKRSRKDLKDLL